MIAQFNREEDIRSVSMTEYKMVFKRYEPKYLLDEDQRNADVEVPSLD